MQEVIDATLNIPNVAADVASGVASAPLSVYDFLNSLIGWDLGTTIVGTGMMATASLTDIVPYIGSLDDPVLYPIGALFIEQASQNRNIPESAETIFIDKIGGAIRSIVPGIEHVVPEKSTDPTAYAVGGAVAGAVTIGALALAINHFAQQ